MFKDLFKRSNKSQPTITIVSGLPRSGTSMMMKILEAGGMQIFTDNLRVADEDNPKGYYELEQVKALKDGDDAWLKDAPGKVVKVISSLLEYLPSSYKYTPTEFIPISVWMPKLVPPTGIIQVYQAAELIVPTPIFVV